MRTRLLAAALAVLAAAAAGQSISTERVDLYQGDRHLVHLDNATFYGALLHQPHAWAMEFYKDWCGHCQRFAPIWSEVARRTKDWGTIVKVGAINCARRRNSAICRHYRIHGVPIVKLFGPGVTRGHGGTTAIHHNPTDMVNAIVEFVMMKQRRDRPAGWPALTTYSGSAQQLLRNPERIQALVLETPGSTLGRTLQLDLSGHQHLVRVSRTSQLPSGLTDMTAARPALLILRGEQQQTVTAAPGEDPRAVFSGALRRIVGAEQRPTPTPALAPTAATAPTPAPTRAPADRVFVVDMENAIVVALTQEVTSHAVIEGEKLAALRGFLRTLLDFFPGRRHLMESLQQLLRVVSERESITGERLEWVVRSTEPWWPGLPELQPYQACRGSRPNYRGYSCGLWTLFHTLTVQALRDERPGEEITVLPAVHGYIKNFFSCEHCSRHFQQMAAEDDLFSVTSAREAALWLWRAHNKVNKRIAGDVTDDPLHPKRQFPDQRLCPDCVAPGQHDTDAVLDFLNEFYGSENFLSEGLDPVPEVAFPAPGESIPVVAAPSPGEAAADVSALQGQSLPAPAQGFAPVQPAPERRVFPVHTHPTPEQRAVDTQQRVLSMSSPAQSPPGGGMGSGSVRVVYGVPTLVRSGLPPPAVMPPLPGSLEVVPGIMRFPSEMTHVFPNVVRAAPATGGEVVSGLTDARSGSVRTQRRVVYSQPRVVHSQPRRVYSQPRGAYSQPRVVYSQPRGPYSQPRGVYSQPRVVYPLYPQHRQMRTERRMVHPRPRLVQHVSRAVHGAPTPMHGTRRSSDSVRVYWIRNGNQHSVTHP